MNRPYPYRSALARLLPEERPDPELIKRTGWREQRILVVSPDDERLYGRREVRHVER